METIKSAVTKKIVIETNLPADKELFRLAEIVSKLRCNTKRWEQVYGAAARNEKKYWENKADKWIEEHVKEIML